MAHPVLLGMRTPDPAHRGVDVALHVLDLVVGGGPEVPDPVLRVGREIVAERCDRGDGLAGTGVEHPLRRVDPLPGLSGGGADQVLGLVGVVGDRHGDGRLARAGDRHRAGVGGAGSTESDACGGGDSDDSGGDTSLQLHGGFLGGGPVVCPFRRHH